MGTDEKHSDDLETLEIQLLLEGVFRQYGFDFREYAYSSLRRRVRDSVRAEGVRNVSELQARVLHDRACWRRFFLRLGVNVTSMFRDPHFFLAFRRNVVPLLKPLPFIRIWHAGCASGEEVYSMAILLQEEGLYDRCRIYATDFNKEILRRGQAGIYPLTTMQEYTNNYQNAGGTGSFSEYYTARYGNAIFRSSLRENIIFSQHNLASDAAFNEFNVILCRNVMIYFNSVLQNRVHELFHASLATFGVLGLGRRETVKCTPHEDAYVQLESGDALYRKIL